MSEPIRPRHGNGGPPTGPRQPSRVRIVPRRFVRSILAAAINDNPEPLRRRLRRYGWLLGALAVAVLILLTAN